MTSIIGKPILSGKDNIAADPQSNVDTLRLDDLLMRMLSTPPKPYKKPVKSPKTSAPDQVKHRLALHQPFAHGHSSKCEGLQSCSV